MVGVFATTHVCPGRGLECCWPHLDAGAFAHRVPWRGRTWVVVIVPAREVHGVRPTQDFVWFVHSRYIGVAQPS